MIYNIRFFHGGLGDELQGSHLPEILTQRGHEVRLYSGPKVIPFRNEGIKKFLYGVHPFVKGESEPDSPWNMGDTVGTIYENHGFGFLKNWEISLGLEPSGETLPKIYYRPRAVHGIPGLIELSSISLQYDHEAVLRTVSDLIRGREADYQQIVSPHQANPILFPGVQTIQAGDLFGLSDLIFSCQRFISLSSGSHSLAAAIRRYNGSFEQICLLPEGDYGWIMDTMKFVYPGVEYLAEKR